MAPQGVVALLSITSHSNSRSNKTLTKPPRLSKDSLQRTMSDISFELMCKESVEQLKQMPAISEVEEAKCECCGMVEECTPEYIEKIRGKYCGKWICGLCSEAVKEEMDKSGRKTEESLKSHMSACVRFNKFGRAFPVLSQAEAMRQMLKRSSRMERGIRAKSMSPRDTTTNNNKGRGEATAAAAAAPRPNKAGGIIARSSSCIPAIIREMNDLKIGK